MNPGTVWPPSSSDGGHNRSPSDIVGNSELPLGRGGDQICMSSGR